jgi:osmotically-inducible protein OsmY
MPRPAKQRHADASITDQVQRALLSAPNIYARHIDVALRKGVVDLSGYAWQVDDYQQARRDAAAVRGVTKVDNDMELMRGGRAGTGF